MRLQRSRQFCSVFCA